MSIRHLRGRDDLYVLTADRTDGDRPRWQSRLVELHGPDYGASVEWSILYRTSFGWGFQVGRNGSESDLGVDVYAGRLGAIWTRIRGPWLKWARIDRESGDSRWYEPRHTGIRIHPHDGCFVSWEFDHGEGWSTRDPWWRHGSITKTTILGRVNHEVVEGDTGTTMVPMPEGPYPATWTEKISTTKFVRWPGTWLDRIRGPRTHRYIDIRVEGGIPVEGKGENSWDCGMDAMFGTGGATVEDAVANLIRGALRDRRAYGGPHNLPYPMTLAEAEAFGRSGG